MINFRKKAVAMLLATVFTAGMLSGCGTSGDTEKSKNDSRKAVEQTTQAEADTDRKSQNEEDESESRDIFAMDTYMTVTAYGENAQKAVDEAEAEIERLDALLSTGNTDSEIASLNENKSATLSEDGGYLVERALEINKETDGAFDIAIYPVMEAWGFPTQNFRVPAEDELLELLRHTDASKISYNKDTREISFQDSAMKIDLGGIAKGYTSARIMDIFKENGIESGLVNLGGNVQALGTKTDGSNWRIAVQSPDDEEDYLGILSIQDKAVITSGGYERYFEQDGVTYHHIVDPKTGYPAESGLVSVTIVSDDGTLADGLSTSLFIMGKDKAENFWREHSDQFEAVLMTDDGTIYVTEGLKDSFTTERTMEVITK